MEIVQSNLATAVEEITEKKSKLEEVKARIENALDLARRFRMGTLTYHEFRNLSSVERRAYTARFGRPDSPGEARGRANTQRKRDRARDLAKQARKRNRRA